jgi:hypothetical protein
MREEIYHGTQQHLGVSNQNFHRGCCHLDTDAISRDDGNLVDADFRTNSHGSIITPLPQQQALVDEGIYTLGHQTNQPKQLSGFHSFILLNNFTLFPQDLEILEGSEFKFQWLIQFRGLFRWFGRSIRGRQEIWVAGGILPVFLCHEQSNRRIQALSVLRLLKN